MGRMSNPVPFGHHSHTTPVNTMPNKTFRCRPKIGVRYRTEEHKAGDTFAYEGEEHHDPYPGRDWFWLVHVSRGQMSLRGPFPADDPRFGPVEYSGT